MLLLNSTLFRQRIRRGKENIIILGIIAFLVMSFWSLYAMPLGMDGKMAHCPFMSPVSSFCQMSVSEHINQWQQFFRLMREKSLLLSLLISFLVALFVIDGKAYGKSQRQLHRNYLYRYKPEIKLFDYLVLAFSQGIIKSKIYESIII